MATEFQRRVLVIDDNTAIHSDFQKILGAPAAGDAELQSMEEALFGAGPKPVDWFNEALQKNRSKN